jgi:hypothetical protein
MSAAVLLIFCIVADCLRPPTTAGVVRYFAYGSNMLSDVIEGMRGCRPLSRRPAVCLDHRLAFTVLGFSPLEPAFANLEAAAGKTCHGVMYELPWVDWLKICATEGVPFAYQVTTVNLHPYHNSSSSLTSVFGDEQQPAAHDRPVQAFTLRYRQPQTVLGLPPLELSPSRRYLNLLQRGSKEAGLTQSWCSMLDNL